MAVTEKKGYCALCTSTCGAVYSVENDRIVSVRSDPEHPTGQSMCLKGKSAPELLDNPDRLTTPLRRTRPKGDADPGWEPISWDMALDLVAERLGAIRAESGAEAVGFGITTPSGTPMADSAPWVERFVFRFGSPNIVYASELCNWHKEGAHSFTFGRGMPLPDYARTDLIILWGFNPSSTWLSQAHAIGEARKRGAKLIVIDPRETALAREADLWLRVRPGGDAALAMALTHELIAHDGHDAAFATQWSNAPLLVRESDGALLRGADLGLSPADAPVFWDEATGAPAVLPPATPGTARPLPESAALHGRFDLRSIDGTALPCRTVLDLYTETCAAMTGDALAEAAWVDPGEIRKAAAMIAEAGAVSMHSWTGVEQHANATQTMRAMSCLYALTGSFDAEGGNRIFGSQPAAAVNDIAQLPEGQLDKALGREDRPIGPAAAGWIRTRSLYDAILTGTPYKLRAYVGFGGNPLLSQADTRLAQDAFRALEFHVHCDMFMTPTAAMADIVLPVNTLWEREALRIGFDISPDAADWVQLRQPMVSRRGDTRSDAEIVFALAGRLNMGEAFFGGSLERGYEAMLAPLGLDLATLRANPGGIRLPLDHPTRTYRHEGFATPSGLVELYSETLREQGQPPLPDAASARPPAPGKRWPYLLTTAKSGYYCHSQQRSLASLRRKDGAPTARISPELAMAKGLQTGDWAEIRTRNGSARFRTEIAAGLHPGVILADFGWWQSCAPLGQGETPVSGKGSSNFNSLIDTSHVDPVSGGVPMRSFPCDIRREKRRGAQPKRWDGERPLILRKSVQEAPGVRRLHLAAPDGARLPGFAPGQSLTLAWDLGDGRRETRSYSLIGRGGTTSVAEYRICVRNLWTETPPPAGAFAASDHLTARLHLGETVEAQAPTGKFLLPVQSSRPVVFYAAGIGITPFLSALETAAAERAETDFTLIYNSRNRDSHVFARRLRALQKRLPRLSVIDIYSRPRPHEQAGRDFAHEGHMNLSHLDPALIEARALHYLCGGTEMMDNMTAALIAAGVPRFDIFREAFQAPPRILPPSDARFEITFARSGRSLIWDGTQDSLLRLAENAGLALPSGCRVGQCENCTIGVLHGQAVHADGSAPEEDNRCLSCQAVPVSDMVIDA
ncbi:molybdopterin-dependent oxidoreductase [Salipiger sp. P9]|uniref:molybdopterin-dependent oxidoreductase n=1 Tax=Salipiger pentaromativorans TaxID=2943193 RepID=UPI00215864DA|nr:molybdopterin-dependent oxidoreductase [Salipiger pentaromativorans]MCR8548944.1 molybdopterin-dependent oxidoreductase [Salipiger pentaromativorans]